MDVQIIVLDKSKTKTLIKKTLTFTPSASSCDKYSTEPRATQFLLPILPRENRLFRTKAKTNKGT